MKPDESGCEGSRKLTGFQARTWRDVERLLLSRGIPFERSHVTGQNENYLVVDVKTDGVGPLEIYIYENEVGYFLGAEWHVWEEPDYDNSEDLLGSFLASLEAVIATRPTNR